MNYNEIAPIIERLDNIQKKLDSKHINKYLSINQVSNLTSLSPSTIRRSVQKGTLKCSRRLGKLLFLESDVRKWIDG
jgi:predicted DNA-binding transcriptional regulator AlpA